MRLGVEHGKTAVHRGLDDAGGRVEAAVDGALALGVPAAAEALGADAAVPGGRKGPGVDAPGQQRAAATQGGRQRRQL
jgi:hypothetical protein